MAHRVDLGLSKYSLHDDVALLQSPLHIASLVHHRQPAFPETDDIAERSQLLRPDVSGLDLMSFGIVQHGVRSIRFCTGFRIMDGWQNMVRDANSSHRLFGDIPILRRHCRDGVTDKPHLFIQRIDFILVRTEKQYGHIVMRKDRDEARELLRRRRIDVENFRVGVRAPEDLHPERSEEHTSELQSRGHLVCRLLAEKKTSALPRMTASA